MAHYAFAAAWTLQKNSSARMKIIIVANTDWYNYRFRMSLASYLRLEGVDVVFVSPFGPYVQRIQEQGFRWVEWTVRRQAINPFTELLNIFSLGQIFARERPSLVHLHTIKPVLYGSIAARLLHVPAVVRSVTGLGYIFLGTDFKASILRLLVKFLYRLVVNGSSGATVFENSADRQYFIDNSLIHSVNAHLIEGVGVDTDYYQPLPEPDTIPTVLMAGRLLWDKGVGTFIDAARLLKKDRNVRFVLVGEPDQGNPSSISRDVLDEWQDDEIIDWWGWQSDMRVAFAACHVVVLPSFGEGIPTILLEAASCGRPIVATDVPGCRDVVIHNVNGLLVPLNDPMSLCSAIEGLLDDSALRYKMGREGRRIAERRFSSRYVNVQTFNLYADLLRVKKYE